MIKFTLYSLVFVIISMSALPVAHSMDNTKKDFELYKSVRSSVAILFADSNVCTAFLVKKNILLTAAHCLKYFRYAEVSFFENQNEFFAVDVLALNRDSDLALLKIKDPSIEVSNKKPLSILPTYDTDLLNNPETKPQEKNTNSPSADNSELTPPLIDEGAVYQSEVYEGEEVFAVGHPGYGSQSLQEKQTLKQDDTFYFAKGIISRVGDNYIATDIRVRPGNSGGPLFNSKGEVIGLVSGLYNDYALAVTPLKISNFVNSYIQDSSAEIHPALGWQQSLFNTDLTVWYSSHTYLKRLDRAPDFFYSQLDLNFYDRVSLNIMSNFSDGLRFSGFGIGYRWGLLFNHHLSYLCTGIESVNYNLTPKETNSDLQDIRTGRGIYLQYLPGSGGIATKVEVLQIKSNWESILSIGLFF